MCNFLAQIQFFAGIGKKTIKNVVKKARFCRYRQVFAEKLLPLGYPTFDFLDPLRVLLHLPFDEVVAVFAVAEAVAAGYVVIVFEGAEDLLVVLQILLVVG